MNRRIAALTIATALAGSTLGASASIPDEEGVIHACLSRRGGQVRVIDTEKGRRCRKTERSLAWSEQGPRGRRGRQGKQGPQGPAGTVATGLFLTGSSVVGADPTSHTISWTQPAGSVAKDVFYRLRFTTPSGDCEAQPNAGDLYMETELNGQNVGGGYWYRVNIGTRLRPSEASDKIYSGVALFPGDYEFTTIISESQLNPACHGVLVETEVFVDSAASV